MKTMFDGEEINPAESEVRASIGRVIDKVVEDHPRQATLMLQIARKELDPKTLDTIELQELRDMFMHAVNAGREFAAAELITDRSHAQNWREYVKYEAAIGQNVAYQHPDYNPLSIHGSEFGALLQLGDNEEAFHAISQRRQQTEAREEQKKANVKRREPINREFQRKSEAFYEELPEGLKARIQQKTRGSEASGNPVMQLQRTRIFYDGKSREAQDLLAHVQQHAEPDVLYWLERKHVISQDEAKAAENGEGYSAVVSRMKSLMAPEKIRESAAR